MSALAKAGARIATATVPLRGPAAAVGLFGDLGTRSETAETSGLLSVVQRARALEAGPRLARLGGTVSTDVRRDGTALVAVVPKEHAEAAAAALVEAATAPPGPESLDRARAAQLALLAHEAPDVREMVYGCAYLDAPYGRPVLGTPESVGALAADAMQAFLAAHAPAFVGAGAGAGALDAFKDLAPPAAALVAAAPGAAAFTGSDCRVTSDGAPLARVSLAYAFPRLDEGGAAAARLLPFLLGAATPEAAARREPYNALGKLQRDLAEQGAGARLDAWYAPAADGGLFGVDWACPDVRCEDATYYVMANLVRLVGRVSDAELGAAKRAFAAHRAAVTANPRAACLDLGRDLRLLGAPAPAEAVLAVTAADVKELVYARIHDCDHALAAHGPLHELPDYNWIRTASYDYAF